MPRVVGSIAQVKAERALEKFRTEGPYTLKEIFRIAELCTKADDLQAGCALNESIQKFSPKEFGKVIDKGEEDHLDDDYDNMIWVDGTNNWALSSLDVDFTEEQLTEIANRCPTFSRIARNFDWNNLLVKERFEILKLMIPMVRNQIARDELSENEVLSSYSSESSSSQTGGKHRDASPVRH